MSAPSLLTAGITGVGMDFPERRLTNADLEKLVETSDQWILERTGIRERRLVEPGVPASRHGTAAARQAMAHAGVSADDVDLIIVPTVTPDMMFPATACVIQEQLGARNAWGFDLSAACSGFLFGLQAARAQIQAGASRCALVIGTEVMSSIVDYQDRNVCVLFGDGAGAVVVQPVPAASGGIIDSVNFVDGSGGKYLNMTAGGSLNPASHATVDARMHYIHQEGREVFKYAVKGMISATLGVLERHGLTPADVQLYVPHQANSRIMEAVRERLGMSSAQVVVTIDRFGNTTAASIPSALRVAYDEGRLKPGDTVVLVSFGAGFTWGATLLRWIAA